MQSARTFAPTLRHGVPGGKHKPNVTSIKMIRTLRLAVLGLALSATAVFAADANPMVGGHEMFPTKNIVENASQSEDHTTLVAAVKAADLVKTLEGKGPFTVFAPTNEAFKALPEGTVETLLKPENKAKLAGHPDLPRRRGRPDRRQARSEAQGRQRQGHAQDRER